MMNKTILMMDSSKGFQCDREAKDLFTATTLNFFITQPDCAGVKYYEMDYAGNLVDYGSKNAYSKARADVVIRYEYINGSVEWYVVELKERPRWGHSYWLVTDPDEGEIMEQDKKSVLDDYKRKGCTTVWAALYNDKKFRLWFLNDLGPLKTKTITKHKTTVLYTEEKVTEEELLLPSDKSIIMDVVEW